MATRKERINLDELRLLDGDLKLARVINRYGIRTLVDKLAQIADFRACTDSPFQPRYSQWSTALETAGDRMLDVLYSEPILNLEDGHADPFQGSPS